METSNREVVAGIELVSKAGDVLECSKEQQEKCPAYENEEKRCWLIPNTWCGGQQQGTAEQKREACMNCKYFQQNFS